MRIAEFRESSDFWTYSTLSGIPGSMFGSASVKPLVPFGVLNILLESVFVHQRVFLAADALKVSSYLSHTWGLLQHSTAASVVFIVVVDTHRVKSVIIATLFFILSVKPLYNYGHELSKATRWI